MVKPYTLPKIVLLEITETILYVLFEKHSANYGRVLVVLLIATAVVLLANYRSCLNQIHSSIHLEVLVRIFIYKTVMISVNSVCMSFNFTKYLSRASAYITLFFLIYIIRVCFYKYIRQNFKKHMLGGISNEIIWLEKYILITESYFKKSKASEYSQTLESFYNVGTPSVLDTDYFFRIWNGETEVTPLEDVERSFVVELGKHEHHDRNLSRNGISWKKDIQEPHSENLKLSKDDGCVNTDTYYDEATSEEGGDHKTAKSRSVTSSSLQKYFSKKDSEEIFRIISFDRSQELGYRMFKENMRQINNERFNLYRSIDDFYSLMFKVKLGTIILQVISCISFLFLFHETGTFITMLCLPFFLFLLLPSLEKISSSVFFILTSNPFNSGDRVFLDNENLIVRKIALLSTRFDKWNGEKVVINNQKVALSVILNVMRSISQQWRLELVVSSKTSVEKITLLKSSLKRFIATDKAFLFVSLNINEIIDSSFLKLVIIVKHRKNYQSGFFTWVNHNRFMKKLIVILRKLGIRYCPIELPIEIEGRISDILHY